MRLGWLLALVALVFLAGIATADSGSNDELREHKVLVGIPDTGINPYHEIFHRPDLTEHPSTYIEGFPGPDKVEKLNLSLDLAHNEGYYVAYAEDKETWESVEPWQWYWIPETPFVAVMCTNGRSSTKCLLDDNPFRNGGTGHGSGTTSALLSHNPDALIAFKQGGPGVKPFLQDDIPVDLVSVSWGSGVPTPQARNIADVPIYVNSAGNDPRFTVADGWAGHPRVISVGGAYPASNLAWQYSSESDAAKTPEIVSWYCMDVAHSGHVSKTPTGCGTSYAAPAAAGGISKAILQAREKVGYTGLTESGFVVPPAGISITDVREAVNMTATYEPEDGDEGTGTIKGPRADATPWFQWGWGFYDGRETQRTVDHLLGQETYDKPLPAETWMETVFTARGIYGDATRDWEPTAAFDVTCKGLECHFDASDSEDPDDLDLEYEWAFGDGQTVTTDDPFHSHTYDAAGTYEATLTVDNGWRNDSTDDVLDVVPEVDVTVTTEKDTYRPTDEIVVTVKVEQEGTGVEGVPVLLETDPSGLLPFVWELFNVNRFMDAADVYYHQAEETTDADGIIEWTVPNDPRVSPTPLHAPTEPGTMEVTATALGSDQPSGKTEYTVEGFSALTG